MTLLKISRFFTLVVMVGPWVVPVPVYLFATDMLSFFSIRNI